MVCQQKHIDQPMSLLDSKLRQADRYGHYYFDLDRTSSTVFPNFYRSRSRDFLPTDARLDLVHGSQNRNRYLALCRSVGQTRPRCLSPLFPRCPMEHGKVVATAGENTDSSILSKRNHHAGSGRYAASSQRQKGQRRGMVARRRPFDCSQDKLRRFSLIISHL
jgi:hypothetical protein